MRHIKFQYDSLESILHKHDLESWTDLGNVTHTLAAAAARKRSKRSDCPGGSGTFGFNTYNLLAFLLMSFNQVKS